MFLRNKKKGVRRKVSYQTGPNSTWTRVQPVNDEGRDIWSFFLKEKNKSKGINNPSNYHFIVNVLSNYQLC
jgi:hypothetical protein